MTRGHLAAAAVVCALAIARPGVSQEALVRSTCATCHKLPPPDILPRRAWKSVVYNMASLMMQRIGVPAGQPAPSVDFDIEQVAYYYESRAPLELPSPPPWPPVGSEAERFVRHPLSLKDAARRAATANVRFLKLASGGPTEVVAADLLSGQVLAGNPKLPGAELRLLGQVPHPCHVEAVDLDKDGLIDLIVADLGVEKPGDDLLGSITWLRHLPDGSYKAIPLATNLPRVADVQAADFDGDGDIDLVVAAFGWRAVGGILYLENRTTDWTHPAFVPHVVDDRPGAIHVPIADLNHDGHPDFVALISQQYETVVAYLGDGKGGFRKEVIDEAPHPAWGSSGLQLVDLDGDGDLDVLVTNGDMLDDFQLKPYHGIRWLENRGRYPFVPHELASMFGVIRAQAADIDGDGDMDIVACSMVQLHGEPWEMASAPGIPSLIWLEQTSPGHFERHTLEVGGRHLSLDLGDYDGDGDIDIVVANSLSQTATAHVEVWENVSPLTRRKPGSSLRPRALAGASRRP